MIELSVLKHLCNVATFKELRDSLSIEDFSKESQSIVRVLDAHMSADTPESLSIDDLANLYFSTPRKDTEYYTGVFEALKSNDASVDSTKKLVQGLQRSRLLRELSLQAYEAAEGRKPLSDITERLRALEQPESSNDAPVDDDFVVQDLEQLIHECTSMEGLRFRLDSLNKNLGSLRKGDFGFIFARPETGKTTFLASEVTHMAGQTTQPILWINNEEGSSKVMLRCYQAALGIDLINLYRDVPANQKKFVEATKGNILIKDAVSATWKQIDKLCDRIKPALVVFDQIDKIKGFDNDREDLRLGSIYIWARELAKRHCPVIGVCQADGSGEGQRWLSMANVANAKTSKQAEADWILGIGKLSEAGYDNLRYMHLSKNKLMGDTDSNPTMRHGRWEVLLEQEIARYRDL